MKIDSKPKAIPKPTGVELETTKVPKGSINRIKAYCKGCTYCVEFCPKKVLEMTADYNRKGYHFPIVKNPDACTGCNLCGSLCPDFAIYFKSDKKAKE
jgi:2-oxoglutarate ferredoxin oxidoreductase subunit delta